MKLACAFLCLEVSLCSQAVWGESGEYYTTGEEFWADYDSTESRPRTTMSWIWGSTIPESSDGVGDGSLDISERYPDHGFMQISSKGGESLNIDLVKRPPPRLFPIGESFCSQLLPVGVVFLFGEKGWPIRDLKEINVTIASKYSYDSACKCYIGLMIEMGFNFINGLERGNDAKSELCEIEKPIHVSASLRDPSIPRLSSRSNSYDAIRLLQSAHFITSAPSSA
jgi:hypothetical protein